MGVLNVTPDSFSDGGRWIDPEAAVAHGARLVCRGGRHRRCGRRVHPSRGRAGRRRRGAAPGRAGDRGAGSAGAGERRHPASRPRPRRPSRPEPRWSTTSRRGCGTSWPRRTGVGWVAMHMAGRRSPHDAGRSPLRRRGRRGPAFLVERASRRARRRRRARCGSTPASGSARRSTTTSSCSGPFPRWWPPVSGGGRHEPQGLPRPPHRRRPGRRSLEASLATAVWAMHAGVAMGVVWPCTSVAPAPAPSATKIAVNPIRPLRTSTTIRAVTLRLLQGRTRASRNGSLWTKSDSTREGWFHSRVPSPLFADKARTDPGIQRAAESTYRFLDRINDPVFERVRVLLNTWIARFEEMQPPAAVNDLIGRFRSKQDLQFYAAFWSSISTRCTRTWGSRSMSTRSQRATEDPTSSSNVTGRASTWRRSCQAPGPA